MSMGLLYLPDRRTLEVLFIGRVSGVDAAIHLMVVNA
jgi:hypothetical protein